MLINLLVLVLYIYNKTISEKYKIIILKKKDIKLGTLIVNEITILEWKPLFSLKTFYFNEGNAQEIYHTHSFSAYSFLIYGNYIESFYDFDKGFWEEPRNRSTVIYIPKDRFHQITKSEGCRTIMITGPWGDTYKEYIPNNKELIINTHGRKEIYRKIL